MGEENLGAEERPGRGRPADARGLTRRALISGAALLGLGAGVDRALGARLTGNGGADASGAPALEAIEFHGAHQAGIATPPQGYLHFAAFDLTTSSLARLRALMRRWSEAAGAMTAGRRYDAPAGSVIGPTADTGEALGLPPARLTLTFGFGPSLFSAEGRDRFGLGGRRPAALRTLPPFAGEQLDPERSAGDLCVQACANDPQVAFHAIHVLFQLAGEDATMRWAQLGFRRASTRGAQPTSRNLLGFKDGTNNIRADDAGALARFVWAGDEGPRWLRGGSYMVVRRIQTVLGEWDAMTRSEQEHAIGRRKESGAPLGSAHEHDRPDLQARGADGRPVIPADAHIRVASPQENGGERILRRGYAYANGATPGPLDRGGHQIDAGLFFIAFMRDPDRQFIPLQRRLSKHDALTEFTIHTAGAIFACPPGARRGEYVGQALLA